MAGRQEIAILDAVLEGDMLVLNLDSCGADELDSELDTGDDEVTIRVTGRAPEVGNLCGDQLRLKAPQLEGRTIIDASTGEVVPLEQG